METRKQMILDALDAFVRQRSGIEWRNYARHGSDVEGIKAFRAEQRSITKDLQQYRVLKRTGELRDSITADDLVTAFRDAYSGRLTLTECTHGIAHAVTCGKNPKHKWCEACDPAPSALCHWCHGRGYSRARPGEVVLDYCTGQYFPTEYRRAACAVMASALWARKREDMPNPFTPPLCEGNWYPWRNERGNIVPVSAGDWLRASFRKEFGRGIASRWFS